MADANTFEPTRSTAVDLLREPADLAAGGGKPVGAAVDRELDPLAGVGSAMARIRQARVVRVLAPGEEPSKPTVAFRPVIRPPTQARRGACHLVAPVLLAAIVGFALLKVASLLAASMRSGVVP